MHYKSICNAILNRIRAAIKSDSFLTQFKEPKRFTRKRLVSMYQVIVYLFYSNKAAMGTNLSNIRDVLPSKKPQGQTLLKFYKVKLNY